MHSLTFQSLSKAYGGVPALDGVDLTLVAGRVHAVMGENGAGKSTLIKLIAGVVAADTISVARDGTQVPVGTPAAAHAAGFRFIHQELNIVPQVSVAENILLGRDYPRRFGVAIDWRGLRDMARAALAELGATHIDPGVLAGDLPAGDQMLIKIAAALVSDGEAPCLYVLDEPTAALTGAESQMLFDVIARLAARGAAILYVSHRMDEVLRICDDVTVLRDGKLVSTGAVADTTKDQIIRDMTGRDVADAYPPRHSKISRDRVVKLDRVSTATLRHLTLDLHAGEIVGVAGLAGAGQSEFLRMFLGNERVTGGVSEFMSLPKRSTPMDGFGAYPLPRSPQEAWARKIAYIPRERRTEALMLGMGVRANIVLPHLDDYGRRARKGAERRDAVLWGDKVGLKSDGPEQPVGQLSCGNQQKIAFARALQGDPRLLLLDEPTRGVDVGAKFDIYELVREMSARGTAVIMTSSDLPEMLGMCDRILVLRDGRHVQSLATEGLSAAALLAQFYEDAA
jgi:ribose transport system ATP-binding protein